MGFRLVNVVLDFCEAGNKNLECYQFQTTVKIRFFDCLRVKLVYASHRDPVPLKIVAFFSYLIVKKTIETLKPIDNTIT